MMLGLSQILNSLEKCLKKGLSKSPFFLFNKLMKKELRKWAKEKRLILSVEDCSSQIKNYLFSSEIACEYNLSDILIKRRFTTSSVMFRFLTIKSFLSLLKISCDTIIFACCASLGKISYQTNISSVYRRGMQGRCHFLPQCTLQ